MSVTALLININNTFIYVCYCSSQDSVFMRWTGMIVIPPSWRRYLRDLPEAVSLLPASAHCCSSSFCKGLCETSRRASSQRRKGGGETSFCYHIPKTLTQGKNKRRAFKTSSLTASANRGGESWREMKEELLVILRLCLQVGITWKVFWGKNLDAQFHWGSLESQKVGEDTGILTVSLGFTGSDIWWCVQSFSDCWVHIWSLVSVLHLEFWLCRLWETCYLLKSEKEGGGRDWMLCGHKMLNMTKMNDLGGFHRVPEI